MKFIGCTAAFRNVKKQTPSNGRKRLSRKVEKNNWKAMKKGSDIVLG